MDIVLYHNLISGKQSCLVFSRLHTYVLKKLFIFLFMQILKACFLN